jgi:uncharacterized protein YndB with AHSA1/START domain
MKPTNASADAIVQEVTIHASAERIFKALTDPTELLQWWGAAGKFQATHVECDLRPGGKWRMRVKGSADTESIVAGEYRRIESPYLLEFTWIREFEDATETLVRWDLEQQGDVTRVRVTHSGLTSESLRARNNGWPVVVSLLQAYAESKRDSKRELKPIFPNEEKTSNGKA